MVSHSCSIWDTSECIWALGTLQSIFGHLGQGCFLLPHVVLYAEDFFLSWFYWIMTWNLCREKALCTQQENGKTLLRMQILRRGEASSACFPQQMSSSFILINSTMKRYSWCTARTKWFIQTGLRQREQCSLWRRSWCLIKAAQQGEARHWGWAVRGSALSPSLSCANIHAAKTQTFSLFYFFPAFSTAGRWGLGSMPCSA